MRFQVPQSTMSTEASSTKGAQAASPETSLLDLTGPALCAMFEALPPAARLALFQTCRGMRDAVLLRYARRVWYRVLQEEQEEEGSEEGWWPASSDADDAGDDPSVTQVGAPACEGSATPSGQPEDGQAAAGRDPRPSKAGPGSLGLLQALMARGQPLGYLGLSCEDEAAQHTMEGVLQQAAASAAGGAPWTAVEHLELTVRSRMRMGIVWARSHVSRQGEIAADPALSLS